jgi:hypothetical protein
MKKIVDWIKKHRFYTFLLICLVFILPLVSIIYIKNVISFTFLEDIGLSTDSLIAYIAGFEAFIGTVFLGVVAVYQNDRLLKIEEESSLFSHYPNFVIKRSNVEVDSFGHLYDQDCLVYSCMENLSGFESQDENWESKFFIFKFLVQNLSNFNVRIKMTSLSLVDAIDNSTSYIYMDKPINIQPESPVLAPNCDHQIGFIFNPEHSLDHQLNGKMELTVYNYLKEEFLYTVIFFTLITGNNGYIFSIKDQFDSKRKSE